MLPRLLFTLAAMTALASAEVSFLGDIRPLLSDNCFACHGPDSATRMANVRLDEREHAFSKTRRGELITPGDPSASRIFVRITADDPARRMPPTHTGKELTPDQVELVRLWIEAGAPWEESWTLTTPTRPAAPTVRQKPWVRNPIDAFVLARLEASGLRPAPEAERRKLARRLALDLTGLPPTPEEVESYVNDRGPGAYEKLVDHYMAKPAWGEHRARYWLDAARYADTHGLHIDNYREMWAYRDWVINAFNRNLSFDEFTIEQLAGDLLPNPTRDQLIATGFHRSNVTTNEGGVIKAEVEAIYAKDRVDTTAAVWLGLTLGCATCHDHKFDPLTQKDFYSMAAFFRNTTQKPLDGNVFDPGPVVAVRTPQDDALWAELREKEDALRRQLDETRAASQGAFDRWLESQSHQRIDLRAFGDGQLLAVEFAESRLLSSSSAITVELGRQGRPAAWVGDEEGVIELRDVPEVTADRPFSLSFSFFLPADKSGGPLISRSDADDEDRGWQLSVDDRRPRFVIIGDHNEKLGLLAERSQEFQSGEWNHVGVSYDGSRTREGIRMYVNGHSVAASTWGNGRRVVEGALDNDPPLWIGALDENRLEGLGASHLHVLDRVASETEMRLLSFWPRLQTASARPADQLSEADRSARETYFLLRETPAYKDLTGELSAVIREQQDVRRRSSVTHVMQEKEDSEPFAHILRRGMYDQLGERVTGATPSSLPAMSDDLPRNRLGLARWLVDESNPLTARVTVNRFWQELFGVGIVPTSEDFGSQGQPPTHPELLDWLAVEFRESGWDIKKLFRLLVTSSTYRQSAAATAEKLEKDPQNVLLSRGPRFRMDGEMVRDYALATGGLLTDRVGGPSVKPYQPDGIWEAVAMPSSNTRFYQPDEGAALYRRSLYTFWKRSAPPPALEIMNAPTREQCTVRRERTNTPLQALLTMNAPGFVEAARSLAAAAEVAGPGFDARLDFMTHRALARRLKRRERKIVRDAYRDYLDHYSTSESDVEALLSGGASNGGTADPELAALTMVANQLLNLDEALNK